MVWERKCTRISLNEESSKTSLVNHISFRFISSAEFDTKLITRTATIL